MPRRTLVIDQTKRRVSWGCLLLILACLAGLRDVAGVQGAELDPGTEYNITWQTIQEGGGMSTGGEFSVMGTIGQLDTAQLHGGEFTVNGGYWNAQTESHAPTPQRIFLPLLISQRPAPQSVRLFLPVLSLPGPDLAVTSLASGPGGLQITLVNQGSSIIWQDFWVDLYVNPQPAPSHVNQLWPELSAQGGVWGVLQDLAPGESMTLAVGDPFYHADLSNLPQILPAGTQLYVQVDSANADTTYGGVMEGHESAGGTYNNVTGPITLTQPVSLLMRPLHSAEPLLQESILPARPLQ